MYIPIHEASFMLKLIVDFGSCNWANSIDENTYEQPMIICWNPINVKLIIYLKK